MPTAQAAARSTRGQSRAVPFAARFATRIGGAGVLASAALAGCEPVMTARLEASAGAPTEIAPAPETSLGDELTQSGVMTCAPEAGVGFDRTTYGGDWAQDELGEGGGAMGVIVADFDGDEVLDLLVPRMDEPAIVLFGLGDGRFAEPAAPVLEEVFGASGGSAADADGDGDIDVLLYSPSEPAVLAVNDGSGAFELLWMESREELPVGCGGTASWADMDLDGDLDLFLGRTLLRSMDEYGEVQTVRCPSRMFLNQGGLGFEDAAWMLSEDVQRNRVFASAWVEVDDDPYPELYVVSDLPLESPGNRLLDNDEGVLAQQEGTNLDFDIAGMGLGVGDLDGDQRLDFVVPGVSDIRVMLRPSDAPQWFDFANALDIVPDPQRNQVAAWGGELEDVDNDTRLDLVMAFGELIGPESDGTTRQQDEIWLQHDDGAFVASGAAWGFNDETNSRGTITADLDRNGSLDIVKRELSGHVTVDLQPCRAEAWMLVRAHDLASNPFGVGAMVRVGLGDRVMTRIVDAGSSSFSSGGPPEVHFGLGDADHVDWVEVVWQDGHTSRFDELASRQLLDIWRDGAR